MCVLTTKTATFVKSLKGNLEFIRSCQINPKSKT